MFTVSTIIAILLAALILWVVYYLVGLFVSGKPHQVIGLVLAVIFLIFALGRLGFVSGVHL